MSVDCSAKIVYGWLMTNDEVYDFKERDGKAYDNCEYLNCIDAYSSNSDYVYGIVIHRSDYVQYIDPDLMNYYLEQGDEDEDWLDCANHFKEDFPDTYANVKPGFFLVCNWW